MQKKRSNSEIKVAADPLHDNKRRAFIMAMYLHIYRQFIGINTVVAFGGQMMESVNQSFALYANLVLNGVQLVATVIATFFLGKKFGRRPLYLSSGVMMAICCYLMAIGYLVDIKIMIIVFMFIYNIVFGLVFSPVSWAYPVEIVTAKQSSIGNVLTWMSVVLTVLVPPIVIEAMDNNAWAIFMFFAGYTTLSLVYMWLKLV